MDKEIIKEKKIEAYLGLLFCLPAVIGVICFLLNMIFGDYTGSLDKLEGIWGTIESSGCWENSAYGYAAASPTPIFMCLLALVGAYLLKGNLHYILKKKEKPEEAKKPEGGL